jgi:hypothetical protein
MPVTFLISQLFLLPPRADSLARSEDVAVNPSSCAQAHD